MKQVVILIMMAVLLQTAYATTGVYFLEHNPDTRTSGMGGAGALNNAGPMTTWSNPAVWPRNGLALTWQSWIADERNLAVGYSSVGNQWGLTVRGFTSTLSGGSVIAGPDGESTGTLSENDLIVAMTLTRRHLGIFSLGMTGKYIYEEIYMENAQGYAADFGGTVDLPWTKVGISVSNVGKMSILENSADELPLTWRIGAGSELDMAMLKVGVHALFSQVVHRDPTATAGVELGLRDRFHVRGGYVYGHDSKRFSFGVGARVRDWTFDWSYQPLMNDLGAGFQLTVTYDIQRLTW